MTGLLTFTRFEVEAMKILNSSNAKYMVLYTDFDKFKNINDEWGYSIGNEILISYAELGSRYLKSDELFCRITADKFILFLSYKTKKEALERIDKAYIEIAGGIRKNYPKITTVVIGGIYFLKPEDKNISLAVDKANIARKTIKGNHRSHFVIYDEFLHRQVTKENGVASKMREALRNNEFIVYMQPKVDLATAKIIGAEALVRWRVPSGEILGAQEFVPIFEKNGFITELDFYVYDKTMKALRQWLDMGKQEIVVSLNVSRLHLKEARLIDYLDYLLKKYQIPSRLIELEITENMFFAEIDRLKNIIDILRNNGFLISIDDFGSGYSSLNLLKTLPIDILKLDREFFMENHMGDHDKIIISGIISLAKGLGLKVISEGVETKEQLEFLKESCCDMAQGYLFYKPMPMEEFVDLLD
jgi:diguanylate cyclase (GGDEF)-like protein